MENIQESLFGRTCPEPIQATKERTSGQSSRRSAPSKMKPPMFLDLRQVSGILPVPSWEMDGVSLGEHSTLNFGECPSVARESTLSQILEANAPEKYYLSKKACEGILRRAERRGKVLPEMLREALEEVVLMG